jgi:hypothetical protein
MRSRPYESVEALQADLDAWLRHHNHERPHLGYRNQGPPPLGHGGALRQPVIRKKGR